MNFIKIVAVTILILVTFTSCASTVVDPEDLVLSYSTDTLGVRPGSGIISSTDVVEDTPFRVGIIQYGSHSALDDCFIGIKKGLDSSDLMVNVEYQNANFDLDNVHNIAKKMISNDIDVIIPIGTPTSIEVYKSAYESRTPIVFSAVTDPIGVGLLKSLLLPKGNTTGTSTSFDPVVQLDLIQLIQPDISTIGVVYSLFEQNSISELARLRDEATSRGIEIISAGVHSADDITEGTYTIITDVEALTTLTDNNVASNIDSIIEIANLAQVPVYGADKEQVRRGCIAGQSFDYVEVGQKTAEITVSVLTGKNIATIPVSVFDQVELYYNEDVMGQYGIKLAS